MLIVADIFDNEKELLSKLQEQFVARAYELRDIYTRTLYSDELEHFAITLYRAIFSDNEDIIALGIKYKNFCIKNIEFRAVVSGLFLSLILLYSKEGKNLKALCQRLERISRSLQAQNFISIPTNSSNSNLFEHFSDLFKRLYTTNKDIQMLNLYDGVVIKNTAKIVSVDENVILNMPKQQIIAMKNEGNAYIVKDDQILKHIKADIIDFDIYNSTVTLGNFSRIEHLNASEREHQRVHPDRFTKVLLSSINDEIEGSIYDISIGGIGVLSDKMLGVNVGDEVSASLQLCLDANRCEDIVFSLKVVNIIVQNGFKRYCLQNSKNDTPQWLKTYINKRVADVMSELESLM